MEVFMFVEVGLLILAKIQEDKKYQLVKHRFTIFKSTSWNMHLHLLLKKHMLLKYLYQYFALTVRV